METKESLEKWDGHTHSEFCPHGSREKTFLMVEKAIALGFQKYSITEHAPFPEQLLVQPKTPKDTALTQKQLSEYFVHLQELQKTYKSKIKILVGLEVDYLLGMEEFTQQLLLENEEILDEIIYSLHFLPNLKGQLRMLDKSAQDFPGFFPDCSIEKLWEIYWQTIEKMLSVKWKFSKPIRVGHFCLIEKFHKKFPVSDATRSKWIGFVQEKILPLVSKRGYSLDWNVAGLRKEYCQKVYWYSQITTTCQRLKIPLVYGSDTHAVCEVGSNYQTWLDFLKNK